MESYPSVNYRGYWIIKYVHNPGYYVEKEGFLILRFAESIEYAKKEIDKILD